MDKEQQHLDSFAPSLDHQEHPDGGAETMVDYMLGQAHHPAAAASSLHPATTQQQQVPASSSSCFDKLSFSDVLQFADFGPKLALNQPLAASDDDDDSYFFRFQSLPSSNPGAVHHHQQHVEQAEGSKTTADDGGGAATHHDLGGGAGAISESTTTLVQQAEKGGERDQAGNNKSGGRRKRPRTVKTSEEVESQRMTHIAVERNRRRQMNEYLRVLRSLMPGSYVQRGDQASIIGGAIEFIRELEQLIQCLESQKRRRLYGAGSGDAPRPVADAAAGGAGAPPPAPSIQQHPQLPPPPFFSPSLPFPTTASCGGGSASDGGAPKILDLDVASVGGGLREEVAENKSCLADIEVRALGPDAMIKILSRRRPGQLIKTIAALEEMQMNILHTNITTIEQTVLYSFNVKIAGDARFSAEDIAGAVHQILSFIDINYTM